MASIRIRCACGKIYDSASIAACPECGTPPPSVPVEPVPEALKEPEPPLLPVVENPIMLDSDRKKRPWLYRSQAFKRIVPIVGGLVLLSAAWAILRPRAQPIDGTMQKKSKSEEKATPMPNPAGEASF